MVRRIKTKLVLELRAQGITGRMIAHTHGMSRNSVAAVFSAADRAGIVWDSITDKTDAEVYALVFPGRGEYESVFVQPDWERVHKELARVGVTLKLLHGEYVDGCAVKKQPSMSYDRFCKSYSANALITGATSRVGHKAGQTVEVDWSGPTMQLTDPVTGMTSRVYLFVACLPFSRYAFVEPTVDMRQDTWLLAHVAMFEWFGGTAPRLVPDNLKTGVIKHPREGEVVLNDSYRELAAHYSAAVLPGRIRRPKDKSSVENTVSHVATWVIAGLRDRSFVTLAELRVAVRERVDAYNREPFQKRAGSRLSVFEADEKSLLRPLPAASYEISRWVTGRRVQKNGHVVWEKNFYSVPYAHIGQAVDLRITAQLIEVYRNHERLTSHVLLGEHVANEYRTNDADQPQGEKYWEWDTVRIRAWAERVGPNMVTVVKRIFESVAVEEQGFNAALAVLRLTRRYSSERVEHACQIALESRVRSPRYAHLQPILETRQDRPGTRRVPRFELTEPDPEPDGYVRGADYYAGGGAR